jgi:hemerythrin
MADIVWTSDLSVGVPTIDEQHKALIERLNAVAGAVARRQGETQIQDTLSFLVDYTEFHFGTEVKHMTALAYPGLAEHQARHEEFKAMLATLHEDLAEEGVTKALADSIQTLLLNWLRNHIQTIDRQFGAFLQAKGAVIRE